jgi:pyruvate dehydrogenase E1 component alpha subunit
MKFTRYYGHFEGDAQTYRGEEVADARARLDCLARFRARVIETGDVAAEQLDRIDEDVVALIDRAVAEARAAAKPTADDLVTDVYVSY